MKHGSHSQCDMSNGISNNTNKVINEVNNHGVANGVTNGVTNGVSAGITNGVNNRITNGVNNKVLNGVSNGVTNGVSNICDKSTPHSNKSSCLHRAISVPGFNKSSPLVKSLLRKEWGNTAQVCQSTWIRML